MALFKKEILNKVAEVYAFAKGEQENLDPDGYKIAITALLGFTPTDWETDESFKQQHKITLHQFRDLVRRKLGDIYLEQYMHDIMLNFDRDCKGYITLQDLRRGWEEIEPNISWCKLEECFKEIAGNGVLNYSQFFEIILKENVYD